MSGHYTYEPKTGIEKWLDVRLPIVRLMSETMINFPTPKNLNWMWIFGIVLSFLLVAQIVTGIVLAMHYTPHVDMAFASVEKIMRDVNYGPFLRYSHAVGASMFFFAVYVHMFRGMYYGSHKAPREILWILGVVILLVMMATAFMGYVLPWGQMSLWGATVITNLFSAIPLIGESIVTWLWGGYAVGNPTLNRFYSLHYLLPFVLFAIVFLHIWALHVSGNNNPTGVEVKNVEKETIPFHPYYTIKDIFALVIFLMIMTAFIFFAPNYMGEPDNYIEANSLKTPPHIVPEWYFLPFYAILRSVPDKLGGVIAMFASIFVLFILPWLDTSKIKSGAYRPVFKQFFWIFVAVCVLLGVVGAKPAEGTWLMVGRIATVYYFLHFLVILPLIGLLEKGKPVPESIEAAVDAKHTKKAAASAQPAE